MRNRNNTNCKTLLLGQIPDDFSPDIHIPLGPFCFNGKENLYEDWESLHFEPDPFRTPAELKKADEVTSRYTKKLIKEYYIELNHQLKLNYTLKFWHIILYPFLSQIIQSCWEKQDRIENFIRHHKFEKIYVQLIKDNISWSFKDTLDFQKNGLLNSLFNEWLYSRILENNIPDNWQFEYIDKTNINKNYFNYVLRRTNKKTIKKLARNIINNILKRCNDIYGFSLLHRITFNFLLELKPPIKFDLCYDYKGRNFEQNQEDEIFWRFDIKKVIKQTLPESIKNLPVYIKKNKFKAGKLNLGSRVLWYDDYDSKIRLALAVERGEKIIGYQHGGHNYGSALTFSFANNVEYNNYAFITWGWKEQEDYKGNFIDLPSPLCSKFHNKHKYKNKKVILVGTKGIFFHHRLCSRPQPNQSLNARKKKIDFINGLQYEVHNNLYYRPYFSDAGELKDKSYILARFPTINILEKKLHPEILKCKLLVLDHPGTTLNLAFAANIPTICFWDSKAFPSCRQAQEFLDKFRKMEIFFEDGTNAAKKANKIYENVEQWWNQKEIQDIRKKWVWQYARSDKFWFWKWVKFLWQL